MKNRFINIIRLSAFVLMASFIVSLTHSFLEKTGNICHNHVDHDFSKVIVNVVISNENEKDSSGDQLNVVYEFLPCNIYFNNSATETCVHSSNAPPYRFMEKLFITKYTSLLI